MDRFHFNLKLLPAILCSVLLFSGCGKKQPDITHGIMPYALNFYILHQEIGSIRSKVMSASPGKMSVHLSAYNELAGRIDKMMAENAVSRDLKKNREFFAIMDSCLDAGRRYLRLEADAVRFQDNLSLVNIELAGIRQSIRNNSLLAKKNKARIEALTLQQSKLKKNLETLRPQLAKWGGAATEMLAKYNGFILRNKTLDFVNEDSTFALMPWEKKDAGTEKSAKKRR